VSEGDLAYARLLVRGELAYLGAVDGLQTARLKQPVARIAASEAQHLSVFAELSGGDPVGVSFPDPLTSDEASNAFGAYAS
jgi:hypothetical protein